VSGWLGPRCASRMDTASQAACRLGEFSAAPQVTADSDHEVGSCLGRDLLSLGMVDAHRWAVDACRQSRRPAPDLRRVPGPVPGDPGRDLACLSRTSVGCRHHPVWQPGGLGVAAAGGVDRRSARTAADWPRGGCEQRGWIGWLARRYASRVRRNQRRDLPRDQRRGQNLGHHGAVPAPAGLRSLPAKQHAPKARPLPATMSGRRPTAGQGPDQGDRGRRPTSPAGWCRLRRDPTDGQLLSPRALTSRHRRPTCPGQSSRPARRGSHAGGPVKMKNRPRLVWHGEPVRRPARAS
jgi:hypothetical protein